MTLFVLKLERFILSNEEHPENKFPILVTLLVIKFERFTSFNDEHELNIQFKLLILFLIKILKFIDSIHLQESNNPSKEFIWMKMIKSIKLI